MSKPTTELQAKQAAQRIREAFLEDDIAVVCNQTGPEQFLVVVTIESSEDGLAFYPHETDNGAAGLPDEVAKQIRCLIDGVPYVAPRFLTFGDFITGGTGVYDDMVTYDGSDLHLDRVIGGDSPAGDAPDDGEPADLGDDPAAADGSADPDPGSSDSGDGDLDIAGDLGATDLESGGSDDLSGAVAGDEGEQSAEETSSEPVASNDEHAEQDETVKPTETTTVAPKATTRKRSK